MNSSTNTNNTIFSPYLLSRFHQHLNHLNDMAFAHTKLLQEMIEKRSIDSIPSPSPHGSISSFSPTSSSSTTMDSNRKRSYPCHDEQQESKHEHKRSRKQSKPQQLVKIHTEENEQSASQSSSEDEEEEEMGEINESSEKPNSLPIPPSTLLPFPSDNLPFLNYVQDLARANHLTSPIAIGRFLENLHKEHLPTATDSKHIPVPLPLPPSLLPQTVHHHHHHPYLSQILFNNSFINHFPSSLTRFAHPHTDEHSFHFSTPKKRRTKVTDTRLSPRITSKMASTSNMDDLTDDEISSSDDHPIKSEQQSSIEYNGFQISDLFFPSSSEETDLTCD